MCILFGFASKKASFELAKKLIHAGVVEKDASGKLRPKNLFSPLPVLGSIQAGHPTFAEQHLLDTMSLNNYLVERPDHSYILKVTGDSMIEAGIYPGDMVIVEKDRQPKNGDVVVAFIDNGFTLKYYREENTHVYLAPANKKYPPMYPQEELTIFGIVVSVMRKYY